MTINDVGLAVPGDNVTLTCSATGDTPFIYQWTIEGNSTDILNTNTSVGILELMDIQESQFVTYICTVINDLGQGMSSVNVVQAGMLYFMTCPERNVSFYKLCCLYSCSNCWQR